jgi:hypothetical protein
MAIDRRIMLSTAPSKNMLEAIDNVDTIIVRNEVSVERAQMCLLWSTPPEKLETYLVKIYMVLC